MVLVAGGSYELYIGAYNGLGLLLEVPLEHAVATMEEVLKLQARLID